MGREERYKKNEMVLAAAAAAVVDEHDRLNFDITSFRVLNRVYKL